MTATAASDTERGFRLSLGEVRKSGGWPEFMSDVKAHFMAHSTSMFECHSKLCVFKEIFDRHEDRKFEEAIDIVISEKSAKLRDFVSINTDQLAVGSDRCIVHLTEFVVFKNHGSYHFTCRMNFAVQSEDREAYLIAEKFDRFNVFYFHGLNVNFFDAADIRTFSKEYLLGHKHYGKIFTLLPSEHFHTVFTHMYQKVVLAWTNMQRDSKWAFSSADQVLPALGASL